MTRQKLASMIAIAALIALSAIVTSAQTISKRAPFEFFNGFNRTSQFGEGIAIVTSNPKTGKLNVDVRATQVANGFGKSGVGFTYIPNFNGRVLVRSSVRINPPSFDLISLLRVRLPVIGSLTPGIASIDSYSLFSAQSSAGSGTATNRFRAAILTPLSSGLLPLVTKQQQYKPARIIPASVTVSVRRGQPVRICGGMQSKAVATSPLAFLAMAKGLYYAEVLQLSVTRQ